MPALIFLVVALAAAKAAAPLTRLSLTVGIGRVLSYPRPIGAIHLRDTTILRTTRVQESDSPLNSHRLLLVPTGPGKTDLVVHDQSRRIQESYSVEISPRGTDVSIRAQEEDERREGQPVTDLTLAKGATHTLTFPSPIGAIFQGDPAVANYARVANNALTLIGKQRGVTDLSVHSASGNLIKRIYLRVGP